MKRLSFRAALVLALVLANLLFWLWTQGGLRLLGLGPTPVEEPERQARQVAPDALTLRPSVAGEPAADGQAPADDAADKADALAPASSATTPSQASH